MPAESEAPGTKINSRIQRLFQKLPKKTALLGERLNQNTQKDNKMNYWSEGMFILHYGNEKM